MAEGTHRIGDRPWWRRFFGARLTVVLALSVALLSVATGVLRIGYPADFGSLSPLVPDVVQQTAGFTGALTGFLMVGSSLALRRGLRAGWYATLFLLPVTTVQGLLQASPYSVPLVVVSLVTLPVLVLNRSRFDRPTQLTTTQLAAGAALVGVQAYGTVGAYALRDDFDNVVTLVDAFYWTFVTSSTVGYGDVTPAPDSPQAKLFTMSVIVLGVASFGIAIGALVGPAIQARISKTLGKMTDSELELLENHVLVLGYGDLTEPIVAELDAAGTAFALVTDDENAADELRTRGVTVVEANPSDDEPLERAKIADAVAVVVATDRDAEDALAILTARQLRPDVRIVTAATDRDNATKLRRAGADDVISLSELGGHLLVTSALGTDESPLVDRLLTDE